MGVPSSVTATPLPTRTALVATLATVAAVLATTSSTTSVGALRAALAVLPLLFAVRVAGQLVVLRRSPRWLPPMDDWNLLRYDVLLPIQLVLLTAMVGVTLLADAGGGLEATGAVLRALAFAYWAAMGLRYTLRMMRRPEARWFGGTIPIVFHCVLAAYLFELGTLLAH